MSTNRGLRFDPHDPADLERLCAELSARTGRAFITPAAFEWPENATDPHAADGWQTYSEDPAVRHFEPATRTVVDVSFTGDDAFRVYGWVWAGGDPPACRVVDRVGRFHRCGAAELAEGIGAILFRLLGGPSARTGDTP